MRKRFNKQVKASLPAPIELEIEKFSHDGRGIARHQGRVVMVAGALPGERVIAKIEQAKSKLWQGRTIEILQQSGLRQTAKCAHFQSCGGCQLQHISHTDQLEIKLSAVNDHFYRNGLQKLPWQTPLISSPYAYRHRARLHISTSGKIGFLTSKGKDVVHVDKCPVVTDALAEQLILIKNEAPLIGLNQFELVVDDFGKIGCIGLRGQRSAIESFHFWADQQGWFVNKDLEYRAGSAVVYAKPGGFTQVNRDINSEMLKQAEKWLGLVEQDRLLDLFCGNGNFSLALAPKVSRILGIESNNDAILLAKASVAHHKCNAQFRVADLYSLNTELCEIVNEFNPTVVLLDPPRAGAEQVIDNKEILATATKILYVSCDPTTLARDVNKLVNDKWHLSKIGLIDMFPQTRHIECMALLTR